MLAKNRRGLAHFAESSEQNVPVPLSADGSKSGGKDVVFMFARGGLMAIDPVKGETISEFPYRATQTRKRERFDARRRRR